MRELCGTGESCDLGLGFCVGVHGVRRFDTIGRRFLSWNPNTKKS
jgi:hypothetical protein